MGFLAVKNVLSSFYNPSTSSAVVKAALLNLYRPSTGSKCTYQTSTSLQPALCCSIILHRHSTGFKVYRQNLHHNPLQAFNRLCSSQHGLAEPLQFLNRQRGSQNWPAELLHAINIDLAVVKTGMTILYSLSAIFVAVKMAWETSTSLQPALR